MSTPLNLIIFDCDSTLSAIEGIDELGRLRGPDVFARVEAMTHDAMNGKISVESVFGERLRIIQPRAADVAAVGKGRGSGPWSMVRSGLPRAWRKTARKRP
jgi:phosphoserine phosphatase